MGLEVRAEDFNATVYNLNNNDTYVIDGTYVAPKPSLRERYRKMNDELSESIARNRAEHYAEQQVWELRRQTELLEKIANK